MVRTGLSDGLPLGPHRLAAYMPPSYLIDLVECPSALRPGRALEHGHGQHLSGLPRLGGDRGRHGPEGSGRGRPQGGCRRRLAAFPGRRRDAAAGAGHRWWLHAPAGLRVLSHPPPRPAGGVRGEHDRGGRAGATLLLYGFTRPPKLAPMYAGVSTHEVRDRFGSRGWNLLSAEPMSADALVVAGQQVGDRFEAWRYRLRLNHQAPES